MALLSFGSHFGKSALTRSPTTRNFADKQIPIPLWVKFKKMVVSEGGVGIAHSLLCLMAFSILSNVTYTHS